MNSTTLGQKITALRKARGMTQEELSEAIGVTRQTISKWELDASTPDLNYLCALADLFGVTTDYLIRPDAVLETKAAPQETALPTEPTSPVTTEPPPSAAPATDAPPPRKQLNTRPAGWVMVGLTGILLLVALLSLLTDNQMPELLIFAGVAAVFALELLLIRYHTLFAVMWTAWGFWSFSVTVMSGSPFVLLAMMQAGASSMNVSIAFIMSILWVFYTAFCIGATVGVIRKHIREKKKTDR